MTAAERQETEVEIGHLNEALGKLRKDVNFAKGARELAERDIDRMTQHLAKLFETRLEIKARDTVDLPQYAVIQSLIQEQRDVLDKRRREWAICVSNENKGKAAIERCEGRRKLLQGVLDKQRVVVVLE